MLETSPRLVSLNDKNEKLRQGLSSVTKAREGSKPPWPVLALPTTVRINFFAVCTAANFCSVLFCFVSSSFVLFARLKISCSTVCFSLQHLLSVAVASS